MIKSKLAAHVVGGGLLALTALSSAHAVVVTSPAQNIAVPGLGVYINVITGELSQFDPGYDIQVYGFGVPNFVSQLSQAYVSSPNSRVANLVVGATVDNGSTYHNGIADVTFGSLANQWALNSTNYFGFQFFAEGTPGSATLHYGYGMMIVGASPVTRTIGRLFYESTPMTAITVVPEPASAALLLAGGLGLVVLRRLRRSVA